MQKIVTRLIKRFTAAIVFTALAGSAMAQQISVTGLVADTNGQVLIGATVIVKGSGNVAVTNTGGEFSLANIPADGTLQVSYIGYKAIEVPVNNRTHLNIVMEEDRLSVEDIVVMGYGTQKKETLTGAVSTLSGDKVMTTRNSSLAQSIQGKIAGVQIRQQDGQPGAFNSMVQIRGFGNPLYVIDGVVRDSGDGGSEFQRLNSEDIESISVLKDGSAAIYGMNAANGVIIVTTKRGAQGKARFRYNGSVTAVYPTQMLDVMNAAQYMEVMNEYSMNNGTGPYTTAEELAKWQAGGPSYYSTDWMGAVFKNHALSTQHTLSVDGGNENVTYYTSLGYTKDGDLTRAGDFNYDRYNFRSNITAKLSKYLTADVNVAGRYDRTSSPIAGIFEVMFKSSIMRPTSSIYANDNPDYLNPAAPFNNNPMVESNGELSGFNKQRNRSMLSTVSLRFDTPWVEGLFGKIMGSYDGSDNRTTHERRAFSLYTYDALEDTYSAQMFQDPSTLYLAYSTNNRLNIQGQVGYSTSINSSHNISVMGLYELTKSWWDGVSATREYEIYSKPIIDLGSQTNLQNSGSYGESANISYLGRLNYDYRGKYLVEGAFRYNGSYRYAPDKRWGFFPVASVGWRLSEEPFVKDNLSFINNIKLRASYGATGIDAGNEFQWVEGFSLGTTGYEFIDGVYTNGIVVPSLINPYLTWIKSKTFDLGVDVTLWNGMLDIVFDVYQRDRKGLLATSITQITNTFGASLPQENLNADRTQGIEFTVGHTHRIGDIFYNVSGNMNFARTKYTKFIHGEYSSSWDKWRAAQEGRWTGIGWGYKTAGQFTSMDQIYNAPVQTGDRGNTLVYPGDYYLRDTNGDGYIDGADLLPMYYSFGMPALNFGFNLGVQWKNFDFYALFQGSSCYSLQIPDNLRNYAPWEGNSSAYLYDRWHRADPFDLNSEWIAGKNPSARNANYMPTGNNAQETDRNTVDGTYLRLKSIELGYTLPQKATKFIGLESVRVYVNAYNVLTFYNSYLKNQVKVDPEKTLGQDNRMMNYPLATTLTFGININF